MTMRNEINFDYFSRARTRVPNLLAFLVFSLSLCTSIIIHDKRTHNRPRRYKFLSLAASVFQDEGGNIFSPLTYSPDKRQKMGRGKNKNNRINRRRNSKRKEQQEIDIVGPDFMELLKGRLCDKDVVLILSGESHEDSIDVTRKGGRFAANEGWIDVAEMRNIGQKKRSTDMVDAYYYDYYDQTFQDSSMRLLDHSRKSIPMGKCQEWASNYLEQYYDGCCPVFLIWVGDDGPEVRVRKGKSYLLEVFPDGYDLDEEVEMDEGWFQFDSFQRGTMEINNNPSGSTITMNIPVGLSAWLESLTSSASSTMTTQQSSESNSKSNQGHYRVYEWGDLDLEAFEVNKRRLLPSSEGGDISYSELDKIINNRKIARRTNECIWTWDDWFEKLRHSSIYDDKSNDNKHAACDMDGTNCAVQLILEASVPPWEVELHRPTSDQNVQDFQLPLAADCVRCVGEDDDQSMEDEFDPSSDGIGSYLDFVYRRFMDEMMMETENGSNEQETAPENNTVSNFTNTAITSRWLHCIDSRDLGCQAACHAETVEKKWNSLLLPDELEVLVDETNSKGLKNSVLPLEVDSSKKFIKFVPETRMNPERAELERLKSNDLLACNGSDSDNDDEESEDDDDDDHEFTFPSFEGFFGQNTDHLYYASHSKLSYSPFLARCVRSLSNWENFFTDLFLGGSISDALSCLNLNEHRDHVYVRSPIYKSWNPDTATYEYRERAESDQYISYPFFPYIFYLAAKGSSPSRTWSSQLYETLASRGGDAQVVAKSARTWTLEAIQQHSKDPKGSDDPLCGGEWFEAFLKAEHREIYDDIDTTDASVLLRKNTMKSMTSTKKYKIGKIQIPNSEDIFSEISHQFGSDVRAEEIVSSRVEVLTKIVIDIWMSNLIDFSSVLKVADVVSKSKSKEVVVVCYMGSVHARAIANFYVNQMGFKKKKFIGKIDWEDENEPHTLKLPPNWWKFSDLFN